MLSGTIKDGCKDWISGNTPDLFSNHKDISGKASGLLTKFKNYKDNTWMKNAKGQSTRSVPLDTSIPSDMSMRDGPGGGSVVPDDSGNGGHPISGLNKQRITYHYQKWTKKLYMLCGVPTWNDNGTLRFGKVLPTANTT